MRSKIAILGASYLQKPLVLKAKEMGLETHVFAWQEGSVVDDIADFFYPISILDKEEILAKCRQIGIDGIISIASDIAMPTVNYVAHKLSLVGNTLNASLIATDKFEMRKALQRNGISCPKFSFYQQPNFKNSENFKFPIIVKPTDRSGSKGVTKVEKASAVNIAIEKALNNSINKRVIVEEFIENAKEFSVEMISYKGKHYSLAITDKSTTGEPFFVETEHHQPANLSKINRTKIMEVVKKALGALEIKNGASHSEVFFIPQNGFQIGEIGSRMGGDLIGSHLVPLSTGYDFVKAVIDVALDQFEPVDYSKFTDNCAGVYFVLPTPGKIIKIIDRTNKNENVVQSFHLLNVGDVVSKTIDESGKRAGIIIYKHLNKRITLNPEEMLDFKTMLV